MDDPNILIDTGQFQRIFQTDIEPSFREIAWLAGRAGRPADIDMGKSFLPPVPLSSPSSQSRRFIHRQPRSGEGNADPV
jgi:hypothetical protein